MTPLEQKIFKINRLSCYLNLKKKSIRRIKRSFVDLPNCCHGNDRPPHAVSNSPPNIVSETALDLTRFP